MGALKNAAIREAEANAIDNDRTLARVREILNRERADRSRFCECDACKSGIGTAVATEGFCCSVCGYEGRPRAMCCTCEGTPCVGPRDPIGDTGCGHGFLVCPACDDGCGAIDAWEIVREIREALAG